ncbi:biopolymer transporter ExbD [candidate division KSB1 bacterium]|nr:biopolymer transporter ExbD [bacterium]RKY80771.1 MAG: biopolymer transporter ExbD [candidate division KSB1 bacterium]HEC31372.1 biopolymer transporter ExbD [Deltaproteobacteria bacterium]RKY81291.1 MAG: biopolymer transporter ExbD [candidate division KSB1 bacterium]RKY84969.1 MAG: biopolymer transporter ExbD [candidate division KSB1 bacterium]
MSTNEEKSEETKAYASSGKVKFERKQKIESDIPTASMPDVVFLLLMFFMISSVFKEYTGLPVNLPTAKQIEKLPGKRNVAYIWIDRDGKISIDDKLVDVHSIAPLMYQKRVKNPRIIVSMKIDRSVKMKIVTEVQQQLREADALRINYSAKYGE